MFLGGHMKKFILALMVVSTLVSCGKDGNKVSSGAGSAVATDPITVTVQGASLLGGMIDSYTTSFGSGTVIINNAYYTWNQIVANSPNVKYNYSSATASTSSNCQMKWGIFYVCSSSSSNSSTIAAQASRVVVNSSVVILTKQNELKAIINRVSPYYPIQNSGSIYYVRTVEGAVYTIDTRLPLQANPSAVQQANGQIEYFLGGSF